MSFDYFHFKLHLNIFLSTCRPRRSYPSFRFFHQTLLCIFLALKYAVLPSHFPHMTKRRIFGVVYKRRRPHSANSQGFSYSGMLHDGPLNSLLCTGPDTRAWCYPWQGQCLWEYTHPIMLCGRQLATICNKL